MMRRVAAFVIGVAAIVAWTPADASALGTGLGGYQGTAAGSGLQVDYTPQGALPLPSLVDIGSPDAVATISRGPSTYAQASVLDPGDLLANPDALLTLAISGYPSGTVPAYPYRIAANSGFGEHQAESDPAPGLHAEVDAESDGSVARATTAQAAGAPIATLGSMLALATTHTDGDTVTVHSLTKASGVSLLRIINIDSVITDLTAVSKGAGTKLSGGTKVVGATIGGRPITIDGSGVHPKSVNDALKRAGLRLTVSGPTQTTSESTGRLASGGLRLDFDNTSRNVPGLAALFDAFPTVPNMLPPGPPTVDDLLVALQARNVAGLEIGRGVVSLAATKAYVSDAVDDLPFIGDLGGDLGGYSAPSIVGGSDLVPGGLAPVLGRARPVATSTSPVSPFGVGIGGLLLVALLAQPFLGEALARLSNALLAPTGAEHCDAEDL
jgi:hypothetical protein